MTISALYLGGAMADGADSQPAPTRVVTFVEVRHDAVDRGRILLKHYGTTLRQHDASLYVEVLQEIDRPERFVILETATHADELTGPEAAGQAILSSLNDLLIAPPDRRTNREFGGASATSTAPSGTAPLDSPRALYVIAHLDIGPPDQARGAAALQRLVDTARNSPGNLRFEAWQQANRPNHFNLVAIWTSRSKLDEFTGGSAAREYRATVAPLIGSPYDERFYRPIEQKYGQ
jgi:quinol monooxygenase YgiN